MKTRKLTPLGVVIKKALIDKGMTQVQLADNLGVNPKYINLILHGERSGKKYLDDIANLLELEPEKLLQTA
ncbi:hypothetical protein 10S7_21 [uncultured Caudovirales phage]|uniref:HTH cro/C1-type domain-containing protein n=1 Tax=uncultured Caudovirales phage TaxID=2100421 RepID=A0A2H4JHB2_9CAUD|nr:hypothetical protein 10S7_21 [uncultured Caudovirales phage]